MSKPKVIKDYDKLDLPIKEQIKLAYPYGFDKYLVTFKGIKGKFVSALPFEADDRYYLVRMTRDEANKIILHDDDYGEDGRLKKDVRLEYEEKYEEIEMPVEVNEDSD